MIPLINGNLIMRYQSNKELQLDKLGKKKRRRRMILINFINNIIMINTDQ